MKRWCPLCNERGAHTLHYQPLVTPDQFAFPKALFVLACSRCGMVYSDVPTKPSGLTAYYEQGNYSPDKARQLKQLSTVADYLVEQVPPSSRVMDIGCSAGLLLDQLAQRGFSDLNGIELSKRGTAAARGRGFTVNEPTGKYDLVTAHHVLEHVPDIHGFVSAAFDSLNPGGFAYFEVPDASRYEDFTFEPFLDFNIEHINHFSIGHLNEAMRKEGFTALDLGFKTIEIDEGWEYPAIYGFWQKQSTIPPAESNSPPANLRESVRRHIHTSKEIQEVADRRLLETLGSRRQVIVRGTGQLAWRRLATEAFQQLEVVAYVDADPVKWDWTINGLPVVSPDHPLPDDVPVIVMAYRNEQQIAAEYPDREVITFGRFSQNEVAA